MELKRTKTESGPEFAVSQQFDTGGFRAHMILLVMMLLLMVNYMDRLVFSAVLEPMKLDLKLSDTQAGFLATAFLISMAVFSFPISYLVDRWSRRKAVGIMALSWSIFTYLTGIAKSFSGVFFARSMVGIGEAAFQAGGTAWVSASYPGKLRSRMLGLFTCAIPIGACIGVVLGGYLSAHHGGWRVPFYVFAVPGIVLGLITFSLKDYKTAQEENEKGSESFLSSVSALFRIPTLKWLYLGFAMQNTMSFAILSWAPAYLMRVQSISEAKAGLIVGLMSMMGIISAPIGGILADKWQLKNSRARMILPTITTVITAAVIIVALVMSFKGIGLLFALLYGFFLMAGLPAMSSVSQDVVPPGLKGTSWGLNVFCQYVLGGGWAPVIVGLISDRMGGGAAGLEWALIMSACCGFIAALIFWKASKSYPEDLDRVKGFILKSES